MDPKLLRIIGAGLFYFFTFLFGFWLSRSGKPHNVVLLTIHKLIALAAGVFLVMTIRRLHLSNPLGGVELTACVLTGLFFVGAVITGGLVSTGTPMPAAVVMLHKVTPYLTVLSTALTLYLLVSDSLARFYM